MASSYNELFGLGSHSEDANLEGWWLLQESSGTFADSSSNLNDLTTSGSPGYQASGHAWMQYAASFGGASDYLYDSPGSLASSPNSVGCFFYLDSAATTTAENYGGIVEIGTANTDQRITRDNGAGIRCRSGNSTVWSKALSEDTWHSLSFDFNSTTGVSENYYVNGSIENTTNAGSAGSVINFGLDSVFTRYHYGRMCHAWWFSRQLNSTEHSEAHTGPEPVYSSGASITNAGVFSVGTWALDSPFASGSNGTATYAWVVANAAGSVVDSGSGSSGTADLSSEAGNTVYLLVRASNTGGYDVGDKATRTSAYGSAGDGYYEVASVVAAGGGGGPTIHQGLSRIKFGAVRSLHAIETGVA